MNPILELITIGAKIFSEERQRYYDNKVKDLQKKIFEVEDSSFYKKNMEAKGKAERALALEENQLAEELIKESKGLK